MGPIVDVSDYDSCSFCLTAYYGFRSLGAEEHINVIYGKGTGLRHGGDSARFSDQQTPIGSRSELYRKPGGGSQSLSDSPGALSYL